MAFLEIGEPVDRKQHTRVSTFLPLGTTGVAGPWSTWQSLPNETMCYILCIGGGGSGAGGFTGAAGAIRGGGGGGGSGAIARATIPLFSLPKILYIQPGQGGASVAASTAGNTGNLSYVCVQPNVTAANVVMQSGAAKATAAGAGTVTTAGAGGAAETISTVLLCILSQFGVSSFLAGKVGAAAGAVTGAVGVANVLLTASQMNGGSGGASTPAGNTEFAGGAQTGAGIFPTIAGGTSGGNPGHGMGGNISMYEMMFGYGGSGGAAGGGAGTVAGSGGDGSFPGGGGGGGGGGVTGGRGGKGGDGVVVIISW